MPSDAAISSKPFSASAISGHLDTRTASREVADNLHDTLGEGCDLVMLFASYHHLTAFAEAAESIRRTLSPRVMLGVTAEAVLGGAMELEGKAGLAAIGLRLPGTTLHPFITTPQRPIPISRPESIPPHIGLTPDHRITLLLADPFSTPITRLLPAITKCGGDQPVRIAGGMASGASQPGYNRLVCNGDIIDQGGVGVTISGDVEVDFIVSQGCRPIGKPLLITGAEKNVILELGGQPAVEVLKGLGGQLTDQDKDLLRHGLLIGTVINEYKDHFGRGDFLVRSVLVYDKNRGGIVAGEMSSIGHTIQFHVRDARTAGEDLQLLLDAQQFGEPPFGAMLFTCNGRGQHLFGAPNHDLDLIHKRLNEVPTAGFFCAGEIGPIGETSFLHGHTASLVLFRERAD